MDSQNNHNNKLEEEDEEEVLVVARPPKRSLIGSLFHSVHTYVINPFLIGGSATIGIGFGKKFLSAQVKLLENLTLCTHCSPGVAVVSLLYKKYNIQLV
jgi:hypothetical protein